MDHQYKAIYVIRRATSDGAGDVYWLSLGATSIMKYIVRISPGVVGPSWSIFNCCGHAPRASLLERS